MAVQKKTILIIVDHPLRDLAGCCLIAQALALQGHRALLCPMAFQEEVCFSLAPDIVLINYIRNNNLKFIKKLKSAGIKIVLLDTEGGFYGDLEKYTKILCIRENVLDDIDLFLAWGHKMHDYWIKTIGIKPEKVRLTGAARFDLYHSSKLKQTSLTGLVQDEKIILFNTKVSLANPHFQSIAKEKVLYSQLGFSAHEIEVLYKTGLDSIQKMSELVLNTSELLPQKKIVVRPHPHEKLSTYENLLTGKKNVRVNRDKDLIYWLPHSSVIVHRHCTTSIEAALTGVPALSPQWIPTSSNLPDGEALSYRPTSIEEFRELITASQKMALPLPAHAKEILDKTIHDWLYQFDGNSHRRIAESILQLEINPVSLDQCLKLKSRIYQGRSDLIGKLFGSLEQAGLGTELAHALKLRRWLSSQKFFDRSSVEAFLTDTSVKVTSTDPSCQILEI